MSFMEFKTEFVPIQSSSISFQVESDFHSARILLEAFFEPSRNRSYQRSANLELLACACIICRVSLMAHLGPVLLRLRSLPHRQR